MASLRDAESLAQEEFTKGSLTALKERIEQLRAENELLKKQREKSDKDTHEFVAFFQKELEKKDELIAKLNDQILRTEIQSKRALEDLEGKYKAQIDELQQEHGTAVSKLKSKLKLAEEDLNVLTQFREMKFVIEQELKQAKERIDEQERKNKEAVMALERKALTEKAQLERQYQQEIETIKRRARVEAQEGLDADTRKIVNDNLRMVRAAAAGRRAAPCTA